MLASQKKKKMGQMPTFLVPRLFVWFQENPLSHTLFQFFLFPQKTSSAELETDGLRLKLMINRTISNNHARENELQSSSKVLRRLLFYLFFSSPPPLPPSDPKIIRSKLTFSKISARKKNPENSRRPFFRVKIG